MSRTLFGGVLPIYRDTLGVFCSPSRLGQSHKEETTHVVLCADRSKGLYRPACWENLKSMLSCWGQQLPWRQWVFPRFWPASAGLGLLPSSWCTPFKKNADGAKIFLTQPVFDLRYVRPPLKIACTIFCLCKESDKYVTSKKYFIPFVGNLGKKWNSPRVVMAKLIDNCMNPLLPLDMV